MCVNNLPHNFQVTVRFSLRVICKQPWASC